VLPNSTTYIIVKDGLPSPFPTFTMVTIESLSIDEGSIGASPQRLPHPFELAR
jgi:hypothetical protein